MFIKHFRISNFTYLSKHAATASHGVYMHFVKQPTVVFLQSRDSLNVM